MATKKPIGKPTGTPPRKPKVTPRKSQDDLLVSPEIVQKYKTKFANVHGADVDRFSKESLDWFRTQVTKDRSTNQMRLINQQMYRQKSGTESTQLIGKMYFFHYKAEMPGDPELQAYDAFPLVFLFNAGRTKQGQTLLKGLNMHYLSPQARQHLLMELLTIRSTKAMQPNTRIRMSWETIKAAVDSKYYEPAVHAYRVDRFKSRLIEIPANDWNIVTFLQLQKFVHIGPNPEDGHAQSDYNRMITRRFKK